MSEKIVIAARLLELAQECEERRAGCDNGGVRDAFYRDIAISLRELLTRRSMPFVKVNNDGYMEVPSLRP